MKNKTFIISTLLSLVASTSFADTPTSALEQQVAKRAVFGQNEPLDPSIQRQFVQVNGASGYLYQPKDSTNPKRSTAIMVMHVKLDYSTFPTCFAMEKRGYSVLCMKNTGKNLNEKLLDVYASVKYLNALPEVKNVVLWGHSGGATLLSAYQMIAENGVKSCQDDNKITKCPDYLQGLIPADAIIVADSNWGNATMGVLSLDPAVKEQDNGLLIEPTLDLYNVANGYNAQGNSDYSPEFIRKFQKAVAERNQTLLDLAQTRANAITNGQGKFKDDEPFTVAGAGEMGPNNKLFLQDTRLLAHTKDKWTLVHKDGSETVQVVHSVRKPNTRGSFTGQLNLGAENTTVKNYLIDRAIRLNADFGYDATGVYGVNWTSSYSSTVGNFTQIRVPSLMLGMTGNYEFLAAEEIYRQSPAKDKQLAFIEGATHMYDTCKACERYDGEFGDTIKTLHDYADKWLNQRF
ncbi:MULTISPECIES: alpha/beta hydrolase [Glaesserella]|uniref:Alpha/beta hydrolase n=1 Tax=Glaesserella australis TaxID=2094024 RepID=A0A328BZY0_9PAST|nr:MULTISPECIES: alpha/beta hydrolase [Glaesserella]AUI66867.1 alpha/beta hydrolase [Glaesserella sp. 15-184]RAL19918.1 alpha/beta hydrolase [Glaesserella australis]